jgi:UDP-N-acetyl-D-galactosamine dehydrogenase
VRNTKVADIYDELSSYGIAVDVYDPWAVAGEVSQKFGIDLIDTLPTAAYDGIVLAVAHGEFYSLNITQLLKSDSSVVYDLKAVIDRSLTTLRI